MNTLLLEQFTHFFKKMSRRAFTLMELLVVTVMIAIGLVTVIEGMSYATRMLTKTKSNVIAVNLAREWMEVIYTIRNTNWLRWSGVKDANRLNTNPMIQDSPWMQASANYTIHLTANGWSMTNHTEPFETDGVFHETYRLCFSTDGRYVPCTPGLQQTPYFRVITGKWLYNKETGAPIVTCTKGSDAWCATSLAKEFRFCSRVVSETAAGIDTELCGLITNFEK